MISRYERGLNEPYGRIETIAKALNIEVGELLQNSYNNHIPLFTKIPKDLKFIPQNTTYSYTCPHWILNIDKNSFAIDAQLIETKEEGVYYISPNTKAKKGNFVLFSKQGNVFVKRFENQKNILGTILSVERKFF
jgi:restriction endonuclease